MTAVLEARAVSASREGRPVLHQVSVRVEAGTITALLGANGAGKTTLVKTLAGVVPLSSGDVHLAGRGLLPGASPEAVRRSGLSVLAEGHQVLRTLTVQENVRAAVFRLPRAERRSALDAALYPFPEMHDKLTTAAGNLSGGQQQILALACALVGKPKVLIVDELSLGLAPVVVRRLLRSLTELAQEGVGILLIEQFTALALAASSHAYVLAGGRIHYSGGPSELVEHPEILHAAYLGKPSAHEEMQPGTAPQAAKVSAIPTERRERNWHG